MAAMQHDELRKKQADEERLKARFRQIDQLQSQKSMMNASLGHTVYMSASTVKP